MSDVVVSELTVHSACHGGSYYLTFAFTKNGHVLMRRCNMNLTCWVSCTKVQDGPKSFFTLIPFITQQNFRSAGEQTGLSGRNPVQS